MKKIFSYIVLSFMVVSCASHDVVRESNLSFNLDAQKNKVSNNGIDLMVKPIHLKSELNTFFDDDLIKYGILPIQVSIKNNSEHVVNFATEGINLVASNQTEYPIMSVANVVNKVKKSYWRTAGWTVAFGVIGAVPSMINVNNTNKRIESDYNSRVLKSGSMPTGTLTEGLVFFKVPVDVSTIDGWMLTLAYNDSVNSDMSFLEYTLNGTLEERKKPESEDINLASE